MKRLSASVRGVDALGTANHLYHYPGPYGVPWESRHNMAGVALAATRHEVYVQDADGGLWLIPSRGGRREQIAGSRSWSIRGIAATHQGHLYVNSGGSVHRLVSGSLLRVDHPGEARLFAPRNSQEIFIWTSEETLLHVVSGTSVALAAPGQVTFMTANESELVVVSAGDVFRHRDGGWERLPRPVTHRSHKAETRAVVEVALSQRTLWARDDGGFVHVLAEA